MSSSSSSSSNVWNTSSSSLDSSSSSRIVFHTEHSGDSNDNQLYPNIVITYATTSDSDNNNVRSYQDTAMQDLDLHSNPSRDWFETSEEQSNNFKNCVLNKNVIGLFQDLSPT